MENTLINLDFLGLIQISGDDRTSFLHNLLSNDIKNLPIGKACYATFNNNKGRIIANLLVIPTPKYILLILSKDLIDYFIQKIKIFVLRSKVNILKFSTAYAIVGKTPNIVNNNNKLELNQLQFNVNFDVDNLIKISLPHQGILLIYIKTLPKVPLNFANLWKSYEIDLGFAWVNKITSEKFVAQMLNQQELGAINFKKGCYPGQEVIARTQYLGKIKKVLVICESKFKINEGEAIFDHQQNEVGIIINSCQEQNYFKYLVLIKYSTLENKFCTKDMQTLILKKFLFDLEKN